MNGIGPTSLCVVVTLLLLHGCPTGADEYRSPSDGLTARRATLPTDRDISRDVDLLQQGEEISADEAAPAVPDFAKLMRPYWKLAFEWEPLTDGLEVRSYDASVRIPTYPFFGPPPPFITAGFSFSDLATPDAMSLPQEFYDVSVGLSWMRKLNDRWMLQFSASAAFATDGENQSSDAWQIRGTAFALYRPNERWSWAFGAVATGRQDLPVVPGVGAVWQPHRFVRFDLTFPRPRISWVGFESAVRQHWFYVGTAISGGTWAYRPATGGRDRVTYKQWRAFVGWESTPYMKQGAFFTPGTRFGAELGYVFGREFEFDSGRADREFSGTLLIRATASF